LILKLGNVATLTLPCTKHIHGASVNYAVPAQSVFARFVKLPGLEAEKIDKIISFEAQQNVPFPIDQVVWDYQIVGGGMGEQIQVVIVAIKRDLLDEINNVVEETGLRTSIVGVASMALYNAFCYNYPDLNGCSMLVDIGARTTNVLFIESGRIFLRSFPLGGSIITAAIAREFNESFAAAEARRKRDGFVALGGAAESVDSDIGRVSKTVRSTMTRLHAELMRSITHYGAQQQGKRPARIFLCGGAAGIPNMREFFHEKFELPIEFFNPLQKLTVSASARETANSAYLFGELVGLALRSVTICPMKLNLLPASVVRRQDLEKRRPFFIAAAACLLLALLGWSAYYTRAAQVAQKTAQAMGQKNDSMHVAEGQLEKIKKRITALDNVATPLITAVSDRSFWPQILEELNACRKQTSGSPRLPQLPAESCWGRLKNAPGKSRRLLRRQFLPDRRRKLRPASRSRSTASWCADFTCIIQNSRKSLSITFAIWRIRLCSLSMPKLQSA